MPYFQDDRAVYGHIGYLLRAATADEALAGRLRDADAVVQYDVRRPDARITAALRSEGDLRVDLGRTELRPDVVLTMDGDTAHAYWQGQVNFSVALAKGQIKAFGPVAAILRLVPLSQALFPRYRELVEGGDIPSLDASVGATGGAGDEQQAEAEAPAGEPVAGHPAADGEAEAAAEARRRPRRSRAPRSRRRPTSRSPSSRPSRRRPGRRPRPGSRAPRSHLRPTSRSPSSRRSPRRTSRCPRTRRPATASDRRASSPLRASAANGVLDPRERVAAGVP